MLAVRTEGVPPHSFPKHNAQQAVYRQRRRATELPVQKKHRQHRRHSRHSRHHQQQRRRHRHQQTTTATKRQQPFTCDVTLSSRVPSLWSTSPLIIIEGHVRHTPSLQSWGSSMSLSRAASRMEVFSSTSSTVDLPSCFCCCSIKGEGRV